ncbi:MAG: Gfo/Idh/MocA family oxidoreductase [Verrucomicrobiae bacterium]|nr:Gfo/Idh/MocA family oxidoreductase [Verrucomicrobiae bacterium]
MNTRFPRRTFLRSHLGAILTTAVAPAFLRSAILGRAGEVGPNSRIQVGCIGLGPQGRGVMGGFLTQSDVRITGLCDVATPHLEAAGAQVRTRYQDGPCPAFGDFRELLDQPGIDAVLIATPDHWHVPVALAAVRAGKDLYLEKPLGLSVAEALALLRAVRRQQRIFQFGTQQRSAGEFHRAVSLVRAGRIGALRAIHVWAPASRPGGSIRPAPVPPGWNYDFWLGPAPETPCTEGRLADDPDTGAWKTWWFRYDYTLGFLSGWGIHPLDIALWGHPSMLEDTVEVEGRAAFPTEGACDTAIAWDVRFRFADGVTLVFKGTPNGDDTPGELTDLTAWHDRYGGIEGHGTAFEGTEGWVCVHRGAVRASNPRWIEEPVPTPARPPIRSTHHVRNFLDGIRTRVPAVCPIEDAVQADTLCHLADIATRVERPLRWDPRRQRFVNDPDADRRLALRPMRAPWQDLVPAHRANRPQPG